MQPEDANKLIQGALQNAASRPDDATVEKLLEYLMELVADVRYSLKYGSINDTRDNLLRARWRIEQAIRVLDETEKI